MLTSFSLCHIALGVLLSGRGSNSVASADSVAAGRIPDAEISIVISNREDAPGSGAGSGARNSVQGNFIEAAWRAKPTIISL